MIETQFTSKLVKALREGLGPDAIIFKHADGFTAGIPDITVTYRGYTMWIEAKLANNPKIFEPLQLALLRKLDGYYVIWDTKLKKGSFLGVQETSLFKDGLMYNFKDLVTRIIEEALHWEKLGAL